MYWPIMVVIDGQRGSHQWDNFLIKKVCVLIQEIEIK